MSGLGNEMQVRETVEQIAKAAAMHARMEAMSEVAERKVELPPIVKWFAAALGALGTAALIGLSFWMVSTLSALQQTVTRIDERQQLNGDNIKDRLGQIEGRIQRLESGEHKK